jgi:hypothetical protein
MVAVKGPVLDPALAKDRPAALERLHADPAQAEHHPPRDAADPGSDRRPNGRDRAARLGAPAPAADEERTLVSGSHGSTRNEGQRPDSDPAGEVGPDRTGETPGLAPDPSDTRGSSGDGTPEAAKAAVPDISPSAVDLVWAGRSGVAPRTGGLSAGPEVPATRVAGPVEWRDPGTAGVERVASGPAGDQSEVAAGPPEAERPELAAQFADLLAGVLPFDAAALERGAEQFFAHLQGLGHDPRAASLARALAPWLATGALAAAAVELARRQRDRPAPRGPGLTAG